MNEQLKEQAEQALQAIIQTALEVKDFVIEQAPDVIRQLISFEFWTSISAQAMTVLGFLVAMIFGMCFLKYRWWSDGTTYSGKRDESPSLVIGWVATIVGICGAIGSICATPSLVWFKIWIAPKVFLIEYAASLVK